MNIAANNKFNKENMARKRLKKTKKQNNPLVLMA
jgi:hypothetical protein